MFSKLSIGLKLFGVNALSALIIITVTGGLILYRNHSDLQTRYESRIEQQLALVSKNLEAAMLFEDWDNAKEVVQALLTDPAIIHVRLVDGQGYERLLVRAPIEVLEGISEFRARVHDGQKVIGILVVRATDAEVTAATRDALASIFLFTLFASIIGLFFSSLVQGVVTQPIARLSALIRRVHETKDYSLRTEPKYADEVGRLTNDLNEMLQIVEARDRDLERQVFERTQDLEQQIEKRRLSDSARLESQRRFERAFQHAPIGMAIVNSSGRVQQRNSTFEKILKCDSAEAISLSDFLAESDLTEVRYQFDRQLAGSLTDFELPVCCVAKNGESIHADISCADVRNDEGKYLYSVLQIKDVTEARLLADELAYHASHDVLTGLANRRTLMQELKIVEHACTELMENFSLCMLDLDQFKVVNDTSGHQAGDALLVQVGCLLQELVRGDDLVVRLGGDEFALLLRNCPADMAFELANKVRMEVEALVFRWEGATHRVGVSIGVVAVLGGSRERSDYLQQADMACFAAKEAGRNFVHMVTDQAEDQPDARGDMHWVQRLHHAMEHDELVLYAQPIASLQQQETRSKVEILLRMINAQTGKLIPPGAFLPAAERYSLSTKLDRWVVLSLLKFIKDNPQVTKTHAYWVNLSGSSLGDAEFVAFLEESIQTASLPAGCVNFEITETMVIRNIKEAAIAMRKMREHGCEFALDDFGSGLSSFGYLKNLPVDYLKIDGMFVRDIVEDEIDRMFVKAIIEIAHAMGLQTVAEFVENDDILTMVRKLGSDYGQGYEIARPEPLRGSEKRAPLVVSQSGL